jgi:CheY-like chemotaxis protein
MLRPQKARRVFMIRSRQSRGRSADRFQTTLPHGGRQCALGVRALPRSKDMTNMESLLGGHILPDDMFLKRTKKRVLVVDDDAVLRDLLCKMFASIGLNAVPAENGREAYDLVQIGFFDLVITDLQMPVMDGWTLIKKLRRHSRRLPIVVITGQSPEDVFYISSEMSNCVFLYKPFTLKELTKAVIQALDSEYRAAVVSMNRSKQRPLHPITRL